MGDLLPVVHAIRSNIKQNALCGTFYIVDHKNLPDDSNIKSSEMFESKCTFISEIYCSAIFFK